MFQFDTHEAIILEFVNATKASASAILATDGHPQSKIPALKNAVGVTSFALSQMAAIIESLKEKLQVLQDSYNQLLDCKTSALDYIALSYIPDDIMTDIMLLSIPDGGPSLLSPSPFPLDLSKVCKKWRSLVLSDPRLWSSFQIDLPSMEPHFRFVMSLNQRPSHTRLSRLLDLFHTRSMASPLVVGITLTASSFGAPTKDLLRQMVAHSERWRRLCLQVASGGFGIFNEFFLDRLPVLHTLELHALGFHDDHTPQSSTTMSSRFPVFNKLPALKHLIVGHDLPNFIDLPWHQLRTLQYNRFRQSNHAILSKPHNLVELFLGESLEYPPTTAVSKISLPHLRHLTIDLISNNTPDNLVTPSLQYLSLRLHYFTGDSSIPYAKGVSVTLARFDSVITLTLETTTDTAAQLYPYFGQPSFLPRLRSLHIRHRPNWEGPLSPERVSGYDVALRSALESRNQGSCPPLFVHLINIAPELVSPSLLAYISENLRVQIMY